MAKLTHGLRKTGGRNHKGRITVWGRGGGHKRLYRQVREGAAVPCCGWVSQALTLPCPLYNCRSTLSEETHRALCRPLSTTLTVVQTLQTS